MEESRTNEPSISELVNTFIEMYDPVAGFFNRRPSPQLNSLISYYFHQTRNRRLHFVQTRKEETWARRYYNEKSA